VGKEDKQESEIPEQKPEEPVVEEQEELDELERLDKGIQKESESDNQKAIERVGEMGTKDLSWGHFMQHGDIPNDESSRDEAQLIANG